ncbi:26S proteasome non-ATPase regulatory subunit 12 [Chrysoperla carnea]|uniref:26S proteasome non-ATPase regulatory subunit 12 n=1 Tax=Chrysoperla carnea TaxID=189513 RepID=UPI001D072DF4|nr:26S proteasome non-ATPase regulatory subunit 12 [Chrysoperla carnea]
MTDVENIATDTGRIVKMEVDYSSTCDGKIPECQKMAANGDLRGALDALLALEKQTRTGADATSTARVLVAIVQICKDAQDWNALCEHVSILSKRRSQLKQAIGKMVQECCSYVHEHAKDQKLMPDTPTYLKVIETLRQVTEGKIYVEVERARLTLALAKYKESIQDITGAAETILELQVETYGSMDKREKVEMILEQMRLCLRNEDYIRTQIISKKVNAKFFDDESTKDLKLKYYNLMLKLDEHEGAHLAACKHYRALMNAQESETMRLTSLCNAVLYLILAPHDNEQSDLMHRMLLERELDQIQIFKELLKLFVNPELIKWTSFCKLYKQPLCEKTTGTERLNDVFDETRTPKAKQHWKELQDRIVEHNIRVMAKYYTRISLKRMAELLDLTPAEAETSLSSLVVCGSVHAKTDRPAGVVYFTRSKDPNDILNDWANHLSSLMQLVNKTTHLINKEECVHKHLLSVKNN